MDVLDSARRLVRASRRAAAFTGAGVSTACDSLAYPVVSGNRIYIKDKDTVTLWTVE